MAQVHINNVIVQNNPAPALSPVQFEITFECFKDLPGTFDWKIIYLGSPTDSQYDQIIDEFEMNDLKAGVLSFMTDSNPPNFSKIPPNEILGTTAILVSASYEGQEFFRVGYYVHNEYDDPNMELPPQPILERIRRNIMSENPRIMRFEIEWAKREGNSGLNHQILQQSLEVTGGDPFQKSSGVLQQLEKMNYSYGMFGSSTEQFQK